MYVAVNNHLNTDANKAPLPKKGHISGGPHYRSMAQLNNRNCSGTTQGTL